MTYQLIASIEVSDAVVRYNRQLLKHNEWRNSLASINTHTIKTSSHERLASYFGAGLCAVKVLLMHSAQETQVYVISSPHVQPPASPDSRTRF
jgi:hypothetical protein